MKTEKSRQKNYTNMMGKRFGSFPISRTQENSLTDYRSYELCLPEYLELSGTALLAIGLIAYAFYQSLPVFLLMSPLSLAWPFLKRDDLCEKRKHRLLLEFKEALSILCSFLSAGLSTENAFRASIPELTHLFSEKAMIVREFRNIEYGLTLNKPLEALLMDFAERSGLDDIGNFAEVFSVAKRSGGELVSIMRHASDVIRDKVSITEEILTLNASKSYEQKIMNIVPFLIIIYMNVSSPDFFNVLYTTFIGRVVMTGCLGVYIFAVWLSNRILAIEV